MTRTVRGRARRVWLWRWRPSPLRRRSDVVEAWLLLALWCLAVAAGAVAGMVTAHAVEQSLDDRRAQRHPVPAVLIQDASDTATATTSSGDYAWAKVRWTAADGSPRAGLARVEPGIKAGSTTKVWLDQHGALASPPVSGEEAELQGVVLGAATAVCVFVAVLPLGWVLHGRVDRRRMAQWDAEWARVGPQWGHKTG
ncbi:Rv1733c family protein [Streptomyces justiciae]|uniref:Rv1733c family protein n=1 Tax=Streptomyces justiciae TaxID=2780140 RepID=UPI001880AFAE|nr:hypothetical protein [Streptomyces justiciae]MBE8472016.1 hypothetical protein [Streptomyces justiciae]MCW8376105.1 hypothetical protein [Streptomyces justiciae]